MPRFITVTVGCDWPECTTEAPENDDTVVPKAVALDGKQGKQFLLCKSHLEDFEAIVIPLMQAGVKVEAPTKRRSPRSSGAEAPSAGAEEGPGNGHPVEEFDCRVDGCDRVGRRALKNRTGMAQHVIRTHGYASLADYEAEFGLIPTTLSNTPTS